MNYTCISFILNGRNGVDRRVVSTHKIWVRGMSVALFRASAEQCKVSIVEGLLIKVVCTLFLRRSRKCERLEFECEVHP